MVGSVLNEGVRGLQNAQRDLLKSASEIARANVGDDTSSTAIPLSQETSLAPVNETRELNRTGDIAQPLVELRKQEQLFNAAAKIISVADKTLGSLIDVQS